MILKFLKRLFKKYKPLPIEKPIVVIEEVVDEIIPLDLPSFSQIPYIEDAINHIVTKNDSGLINPKAWELKVSSLEEDFDDNEEIIQCNEIVVIEKSEYAKIDFIDREIDWKDLNIQWLLMPNNTPMKVLDVDHRGVLLRWGRAQSIKTIPWCDLVYDCKWSEDKKTWKNFNEK
jgi:hypothetical protein